MWYSWRIPRRPKTDQGPQRDASTGGLAGDLHPPAGPEGASASLPDLWNTCIGCNQNLKYLAEFRDSVPMLYLL